MAKKKEKQLFKVGDSVIVDGYDDDLFTVIEDMSYGNYIVVSNDHSDDVDHYSFCANEAELTFANSPKRKFKAGDTITIDGEPGRYEVVQLSKYPSVYRVKSCYDMSDEPDTFSVREDHMHPSEPSKANRTDPTDFRIGDMVSVGGKHGVFLVTTKIDNHNYIVATVDDKQYQVYASDMKLLDAIEDTGIMIDAKVKDVSVSDTFAPGDAVTVNKEYGIFKVIEGKENGYYKLKRWFDVEDRPLPLLSISDEASLKRVEPFTTDQNLSTFFANDIVFLRGYHDPFIVIGKNKDSISEYYLKNYKSGVEMTASASQIILGTPADCRPKKNILVGDRVVTESLSDVFLVTSMDHMNSMIRYYIMRINKAPHSQYVTTADSLILLMDLTYEDDPLPEISAYKGRETIVAATFPADDTLPEDSNEKTDTYHTNDEQKESKTIHPRRGNIGPDIEIPDSMNDMMMTAVKIIMQYGYDMGKSDTEDDFEATNPNLRRAIYGKGYNDGINVGISLAWDLARQIILDVPFGMSDIDIREAFGGAARNYILQKYTYEQVQHKIDSYKMKKLE